MIRVTGINNAVAHAAARRRRLRMRKFLFGLLIVCLVPATAWAQKRGLPPQDYYRMSSVSEVALSPAGDHVAFTVTTVVEKDNRRHREVWVQRLKNGTPDGMPFRFTDPTREASAPAWSPDGSLLSFTSRRSGDRNAHLVRAPGAAERRGVSHRRRRRGARVVGGRQVDRLSQGTRRDRRRRGRAEQPRGLDLAGRHQPHARSRSASTATS